MQAISTRVRSFQSRTTLLRQSSLMPKQTSPRIPYAETSLVVVVAEPQSVATMT